MAALLITLVVNGLLILNGTTNGPDDDLGIAMALSGLYPESGQCLFTNALLNNIVFSLNSAMPDVNWFLVIERSSSAAAFFVACYLLLRYVPLQVALAILGLVSYFVMPRCTAGANFTVVAAMCVFSGELCFCVGIYHRKLVPCIAGCLLVVLGYLWRALILALSAPFLALAFFALVWTCRKEGGGALRSLGTRTAASICVVGLLVGGAYFYDQSVWEQPEWATWQSFNSARYELVDYPTLPYEDVDEELAAAGVSESDYWLMTNWITADPEFMTTERLQAVGEIAREPQAERSFLEALGAECLHLLTAFLFTGYLILLVVVVALAGGRRAVVISVLSVLGAFAACVLFRYTGRLPMRVEYSVWLFSLLPLAVSLFGPVSSGVTGCMESSWRKWRASALLAALLVVLCSLGMLIKWAPTFNVAEARQFEAQSQSIAQERLIQRFTKPGTVFVWDTTSFMQIERELGYRCLPPREMLESTAMAGGWTQRAPFVEAHNAAVGASNPLKSLIERPDTYFVSRRGKAVDFLLQYLREHYNESTTYEIVDKVPPLDEGESPILVVKYSAN
ncbi:hypothetical protein [uncultured Adlercreutzia sp.]|uniref:hypothetical protein n=1 Tax=uncultured Adlercreutzia sp. TaxID=875803 RepID=UPI0026F3AC11|nr:hypothetical protein [uncultured Adlercreutzia sp.]